MTEDEKITTLANSLSKMIGSLETCKSYLLDAIKTPTKGETEEKMAREVLVLFEEILRGHGDVLLLLQEGKKKVPSPPPIPTSDPSMN